MFKFKALIKMKYLSFLFYPENLKIGDREDLALTACYTIKKNYHFYIESLWRNPSPRKRYGRKNWFWEKR